MTVALSGKASWDEAVGDKRTFLASAHLFLQLLKRKNGRTWWRKGPALGLRLVGDALDHAFVAFLPGGELGPGSTSKMRIPFTPAEVA